MEDTEIEQKIIEFLKQNREEFTLTQLVEKTGLSFPSVSKYIGILEVKGLINLRQIGQLKLVRLKNNVEETGKTI